MRLQQFSGSFKKFQAYGKVQGLEHARLSCIPASQQVEFSLSHQKLIGTANVDGPKKTSQPATC